MDGVVCCPKSQIELLFFERSQLRMLSLRSNGNGEVGKWIRRNKNAANENAKANPTPMAYFCDEAKFQDAESTSICIFLDSGQMWQSTWALLDDSKYIKFLG
jgi:hypothetical protein